MNRFTTSKVALGLIALVPFVAHAADVTFQTNDGTWNTGANWSSGSTPGTTDKAVIDNGDASTLRAVLDSANATVQGMTIGDSDQLDLASGRYLYIRDSGGPTQIHNDGTINYGYQDNSSTSDYSRIYAGDGDGVTLTGSGTINFTARTGGYNQFSRYNANDSLDNQGNTIRGSGYVQFNGIDNAGTFQSDNANRDLRLYGYTNGIDNSGTLRTTNNGYLYAYGDAGGISNSGTVEADGGLLFLQGQNGAISNSGTIQTTTTGGTIQAFSNSGQSADNSGLIDANTGTVMFYSQNADMSNSGTLRARDGGTLTVGASGGNLDNSGGTIEAQSGGEVRLYGNVTGGTVDVQDGGTLNAQNGAVIDANAVTLTRSGTNVIGGYSTATLKNIGNANANETIRAHNGAVLHLESGGTLSNEGTIDMQSTGSATNLYFDDDTTLSGTGSLTTSGTSNSNYIRGKTGTETLTNAAGHTISAKAYLGYNALQIVNQGTIQNDSDGNLYIDPNAGGFSNSGTMIARGGRQLRLENGDFANSGTITTQDSNSLIYSAYSNIDNTGGSITATTGNDFNLYNANLDGGTVNVQDGGDFYLSDSDATNTTVNIADGGRLIISNPSNTLSGTVNNAATGSISLGNGHTVVSSGTVNNAGLLDNNGGTISVGSGDLVLQGGGEVHLDYDYDAEIVAETAGNRLINEDNTIRGGGYLGRDYKLALTNRGTINADNSNSGTTQLSIYGSGGTAINEGTITASNGGNMYIYNSDVDNSGGTLSAGSGSVLQLNASTVDNSSGTVSVADTGVLRLYNNAEIQGGSIDLVGSGELELRGGTLDADQVTVNRSNTGVIEAASGTSYLKNVHNDDLADGVIRLNGGNARMSGSDEFRNNGTLEFKSWNSLYLDEASTTLKNGGEVSMTGGYIRGGTNGNQLVNEDNTIRGYGHVGLGTLGIVNRGHVEAETSTLTLQSASSGASTGLVNEGTMASSSGSYLVLSGGTIDNSAGTITAKDGGRVQINSSTLADGQVNLEGSGELQLNYGILDASALSLDRGTGDGTIRVYGTSYISGLGNAAGKVVQVQDGATLRWSDGQIDNAGALNVGTTGTTYLQTSQASTELTGGGTTDLGRYGRIQGDNSGQELVISDQTVQGGGYIGLNNLGVQNSGTINANESGNYLYVQNQGSGTTNTASGTIKASGGGRLRLEYGSQAMTNAGTIAVETGSYGYVYTDVDNTGGVIRNESGGYMTLSSSRTISGGTVENEGSQFFLYGDIVDGTLENKSGATLYVENTAANLGGTINNRAGGLITAREYDVLTLNGGTQFNNEGELRLDGYNSSYGTDLVISGGDVTLSGGGTLNMQDSNDNRLRADAASDRLVNVDNTIHGRGYIEANVHNQAGGTIETDAGTFMYLTTHAKTNDGLIQAKDGGYLYVQSDLSGTGTLAANGTNARIFFNGNNDVSAGALDVSGSSAYAFVYGTSKVDVDTVNLASGGRLRLYDSSELTAGTVTVEDGAILDNYGWSDDATLTTTDFLVEGSNGFSQSHRGTIRVDGGTFDDGRTSFVLHGNGSNSTGRIELNDATVANTYTDLTLGTQSYNNGQLQISGGTHFNVSGASTLGVNGQLEVDGGSYSTGTTLTIDNGGAMFINNGQTTADITVVEAGGDLNLSGGGLKTRELQLNGGSFNLDGGELEVFDVIGSLVNTSGRMAPGASPGHTTVTGDYTQGAGGVLEIELGGTIQGTEYDLLDVSGTMNLAGTLEVLWYDGFTASGGDTFDILDWGVLNGTFDQIILPNIGGGMFWDISELYVSGEISVGVPVPAGAVLLLTGLGLMYRVRRRRTFP